MNTVHNKHLLLLFLFTTATCCCMAQETKREAYLVPATVYKGDTIPSFNLPTVYIFKPLIFKNKRQQQKYNRLVRDVKKVLPIAKEVNRAIIETYEYMMTLPEEERSKHIKMVEKGIKKQYLPVMKQLTFSQGKLLIKLIDRQNNQTSYQIVKAFLGSFRAGFYQAFAALFGASLKKEYRPDEDDKLTERVVLLVESGQI